MLLKVPSFSNLMFLINISQDLVAQLVKHLPAMQETWVRSWVGKIPWKMEWLSTPVFLPGESHGQRSLEGYSPWGRKESDTNERLTHTRTHTKQASNTVVASRRRRRWHPTPVLLPGKSHGRRSLVSYSPCGLRESDTIE